MMNTEANAAAGKELQAALKASRTPKAAKMEEKSFTQVGVIELDALRAMAQGARSGLDCLTVTLAQAPGGRLLLSMLDAWFSDYEAALQTYNTVSKKPIYKES